MAERRRGIWPLVVFAALVVGAASAHSQQISRRESDLRESLGRYQEIVAKGGWPVVPAGPVLGPDSLDPRVPRLRERLAIEGYLEPTLPPDSTRYDAGLEAAVRQFQRLHGLEEDGVVGPATLLALNVPAGDRAGQIEAELAPDRLLAADPGDRYILVNIPAFTLDLVEADSVTFRLRTIVGRPTWPTPTVSSLVTAIVFGPIWRIPRSIAVREVLPLARRDSAWFARTGTRVYRSDGGIAEEIDPATVDWRTVQPGGLGYQFAQEPGPHNPLGRVKLFFETPYGVFLHDTPDRGLFDRTRRALSHGCVRVDQIERLVARLLPEWTADSIETALATGHDLRVELAAPIPVHLVYWTVWREPGGLTAFRDDVYRRTPPD